MARIWAFLVILTWLGQAAVMATELTSLGGTVELEARIAALEEQAAEHDAEARSRAESVSSCLEADQPAAPCDCGSCDTCVGYDFACSRCRTSGFYGGADIMWLKPFGSGQVATPGINESSADTFLPGWRLYGGNQNCDGLGWRVNWWQWDQFSTSSLQTTVPPFAKSYSLHLKFQKLDLLITQMVSFRKWDLMMFGGVTYAGNTFNVNDSRGGYQPDPDKPNFSTTSKSQFDGWGLTAGLLAYRDIAWLKGLKGFGSAQWSGVYGNSAVDWSGGGVQTVIKSNSTLLNILELKIGTQYERRIGRGAIGFVSTGLEAQYWSGEYMAAPYSREGGNNDLGLVGFTVGTGIRR